jgi:hypothetical protein
MPSLKNELRFRKNLNKILCGNPTGLSPVVATSQVRFHTETHHS